MAEAEFFVYDTPGMAVPRDVTHLMVSPSVDVLPGGVFGGLYDLKEVQLSEGLRKICRGAFMGCISLVRISFSSAVAMIGDEAFASCYSLEVVILMDGIQTIGHEAFARCSSLELVILIDGIRTIGARAFLQCTLKGIVLPATLTEIGHGAFTSCLSLRMVKLSGGIQLIRGHAFEGCDSLNHITVTPKSCIVEKIGEDYNFSFATNETIAPNTELDRVLICSECFHSMPAAEVSAFKIAVTEFLRMPLEWGEKRERLRGLLAVHERRRKEEVAGLLELGLLKADMRRSAETGPGTGEERPLMCKADVIGKNVMAFL